MQYIILLTCQSVYEELGWPWDDNDQLRLLQCLQTYPGICAQNDPTTIAFFPKNGSHGIEPKRDWTHSLKIWFVVAGGGFYSYYKLQCIKLDKEKIIQEKK